MKTECIFVNVWHREKGKRSDAIVIASKTDKIITTISNDPKSKRYCPHLYEKFKGILVKEKKW